MIQQAIAKVVQGQDLSEAEMMRVMDQITEGQATPAQIGAFLIGLRMKGVKTDEIVGAARVMRAKSVPIPVGNSNVALDRDEINVEAETVVDTCGTGGDGTKTFNVSTTTAFVVAGAGLKVAKHGNRSVSSQCGSADVVEALGVPLDLTPQQVGDCIDRVGIGFLYAPMLHGAMRHVVGPRREIGLRTIFNILGPLTNPAGASVQVLGVYREDLTETMAEALRRLGSKSAFVVYGEGSYDEISITGRTTITRLRADEIITTSVTPEEVGLKRAQPEEIRGGRRGPEREYCSGSAQRREECSPGYGPHERGCGSGCGRTSANPERGCGNGSGFHRLRPSCGKTPGFDCYCRFPLPSFVRMLQRSTCEEEQ